MRRELTSHNLLLEHKVEQKTAEIREILNASIRSMALMVEIRDPYTAGHQQRVAQLACAIAEKMGLAADAIEGLHIAGILHDVGKIRIPCPFSAGRASCSTRNTKCSRFIPR